MKRINRDGPPVLGGFQEPKQLPAEELGKTLDADALVIDTRPALVFARGHVPGTINIPLGKSFNTWAGWLVPYDRNFYLIADDAHAAEAARDLAMIGLDRVVGYFPSFAVAMWASGGRKLDTVAQEDSSRLTARMKTGRVSVIDVRARSEWEAGHLPGVPNIPLGHLAERLAEIPADRPVVVQCQSGARSAIAASLLQARGVKDVVNLTGGFVGWEAAGNPVERETLTAGVA